ncbi:deoxycytidylate deaminase-like [Notolabrus celidotus]|uniref:deoxycytidylate deaminase-like n=1 Tax=Notolabrus celidotus TaxID=1203425 RepID=UPI00148F92CB|nr:deoxycytidylate deaminase-like [Notolabrus celidotus]
MSPGLEVDEPEPLLLPELVSFDLSQQQPLYPPPDAHRPKRKMTEGTPGRENLMDLDDYFMGVARLAEERSKDPERQVGACIVDKAKKVVGVGHNRMPNNCEGKLGEWEWTKFSDHPEDNKSFYVCHAELNAIMNKNSADISGCSMYVTLFPCNECAKIIIQSGIKEVFYLDKKPYEEPKQKAKRDKQLATDKMLDVAGVTLRHLKPKRKIEIQCE